AAANNLTQTGNNNTLTVDQQNASTVGVPQASQHYMLYGPYAVTDYSLGVDQNGDYNAVDLTQDGGILEQIQQNATAGASITKTTNQLVVDQATDFAGGAFIGSVQQTYTDPTGAAAKNVVTINQTAKFSDGNYYHPDVVQAVVQKGTHNGLDIQQLDSNQYIVEAIQDGSGNIGSIHEGLAGGGSSNSFVNTFEQKGDGNTGQITMTGNNDGSGLWKTVIVGTPPHPVSIYPNALASGAPDASLFQLGTGNQANLLFSGDNNAFGVKQDGMQNNVGGIVVSGDGNAIGIYQHSDGNVIVLAEVTGDQNDIGLVQDGMMNNIDAATTASNSSIWVKELGSHNQIKLRQGGSGNTITSNNTGDRNNLDIEQDWAATGSGNSVSINITGSDNNNYPTTAAITGAAMLTRDVIRTALSSSSFGQGDLYQEGSGNSMTFTVLSNLNVFAAYQNGTGNSINGNVNTGTGNQAVVSQIGNNNSTTYTQSGSGNNIGVTQ
ncbi:MAG TPA: hypothetical protein VHA37_06070, partial [Candidatus Saccharimonadales bacterium]|nr:hypothetical protein [Candidatus Saccharimonadales bacterium]